MLALVAILLAVEPPTCDAGTVCSGGGFKSQAPLHYGSGTPDFVCGNRDTLEDGGWGSGSKYCLIETHESEAYSGGHGDLTIAAKWPRSAGLLVTVQNPYFGSGAIVASIDWAGNFSSYGSYYAYGNGGGLRNSGSYAAVYGAGAGTMPDVVVGPLGNHYDRRAVWGAWTGWEWPLVVQGDGFVRHNGVPMRVVERDHGIEFVVQQPDGGVRAATVVWQ